MINRNFSCSIVDIDGDIITLTYDLESLEEAENKAAKVRALIEEMAFEGEVSVLDDESDEEQPWVILNIELETTEQSDENIRDFIRKVDNF